ncbi:hypothetical protein ACPA2L_30380 [Bacillus bombysepticus]
MCKWYLKGDGKYVASKFKDDAKSLAYYIVRKHDSFIGMLDDGYIMVDVYDIDEAEMLLEIVVVKRIKCSVLQTTNDTH